MVARGQCGERLLLIVQFVEHAAEGRQQLIGSIMFRRPVEPPQGAGRRGRRAQQATIRLQQPAREQDHQDQQHDEPPRLQRRDVPQVAIDAGEDRHLPFDMDDGDQLAARIADRAVGAERRVSRTGGAVKRGDHAATDRQSPARAPVRCGEKRIGRPDLLGIRG